MFNFLFQQNKENSSRKPFRTRQSERFRKIRVESLEDRSLLSGNPLASLCANLGAGLFGPSSAGGTLGSKLNTGGSVSTNVAAAQATTTSLVTSNATPSYGQNVVLTATVAISPTASTNPIGTVQFMDGTTVIGSAKLRNGVATLVVGDLAIGSHGITAQFLGNASFTASSTAAPVNVTVAQAQTITLLTTSGNPAASGNPVTLMARVVPNYSTTPSTTSGPSMALALGRGLINGFLDRGEHGFSFGAAPTGTVEFDAVDETGAVTSVLGTAALHNGMAKFSVATLPDGATNIVAVYKGDTNYATSSSQSIVESVSSTLSSTRMSVTPTRPVTVNTANTINIKIRPGRSSTAITAPTGTVTLYDATTGASLTGATPISLTASTTSTNTAIGSFAATFTTKGLHLIIATYSGDSAFAGSESIVPVYVR